MNVDELSARLAEADIAVDPDGWALAAFRLALARSELATDRSELEDCVDLLNKAARVLTLARAPVEYGRVMTATGNCYRSAGRSDLAVQAFTAAVEALSGRTEPVEEAAALANLGLALTESGDATGAIEALDTAIGLLRRTLVVDRSRSDEVRRSLGAALVNRAQAQQATATDDGLVAALDDYDAAIASLPAESPQTGLAWHGRASVLLEQARRSPPHGGPAAVGGSIDQAVDAVHRALAVFSANAFPFQHAIARHSLAVAHQLRGTDEDLARAVHNAELAIAVFDPRLHPGQWQTVNAALTELEARLAPQSRIEAVVQLLVSVDETERIQILRDRLTRLSEAPELRVEADLDRLCTAMAAVDGAGYRAVAESLISVLMELPDRILELGCGALIDANRSHPCPTDRDRLLDGAIQSCLVGPQRVRVRDLLVSRGWQRP